MYKVGQAVYAIMNTGHGALLPQLFATTVLAVEQFGGRSIYILACFNPGGLKNKDLDSTEAEDMFPDLASVKKYMDDIYAEQIARITAQQAKFHEQVAAQARREKRLAKKAAATQTKVAA